MLSKGNDTISQELRTLHSLQPGGLVDDEGMYKAKPDRVAGSSAGSHTSE